MFFYFPGEFHLNPFLGFSQDNQIIVSGEFQTLQLSIGCLPSHSDPQNGGCVMCSATSSCVHAIATILAPKWSNKEIVVMVETTAELQPKRPLRPKSGFTDGVVSLASRLPMDELVALLYQRMHNVESRGGEQPPDYPATEVGH
jgi:hypothetical protein